MWVYLHSNVCRALQKTLVYATECVLAVQSLPRSMILVPVESAYVSSCRSLWLWSYLVPLLKYGDLLAENCLFLLPLSHSAPSLPLEFRGEVNHEETRVMGLSSSEDCMIVAWVIFSAWRGIEIACCPSVCLSVTLVDQNHIGWKSWKLIARTLSPTPSLFEAERRSTYSQGNVGKFGED